MNIYLSHAKKETDMNKVYTKNRASKNTIDMSDGSILPQLIQYSIPLIIIGIVQLLFSAADMWAIGTFAKNAAEVDKSIAAIGSTTTLITLITCLFTGISAGTNVLCARYFGSKEYDKLSDVVHTSVILSVIVGATLTALGIAFADQLLVWMNTPTEVMPLATLYIKIYLLSSIPLLLYNFCAAIQRSVGDTTRPMWILMFAGVAHIMLNIVLVAVFDLGVAGVALSTLLSQTLSALLTFLCLIREAGPTKFRFSKLRFDKKTLFDISRIGFPTGLQNTMFTLANVLIQSNINAYDITKAGGSGVIVTGCSIASNVDNISIAIIDAVCLAVIAFTSQNFGAHKFDRIKKAQKYGHLIMLCTVLPVGIITFIFAKPLLGIFAGNASAEAIAIGAKRVFFVGGCAVIYGFARISGAGMRGLGVAVTPMITSLIAICGVRLLWLYTAFQVWYDIYVMYVAFPLSFLALLIVDTVCFWIFYKRFLKREQELKLTA